MADHADPRLSSEKAHTDSSMTETAEKQQQQLQEPTPAESLQDVTEKQDENSNVNHEAAVPEYPNALKLTLTLFALCISIFLVALDQTIIAPALGAITGQFNSTKDIVCVLCRRVLFLVCHYVCYAY